MATFLNVNEALVSLVAAELSALSISNVRTAIGFPPLVTRQDVGNNLPGIIALVHRFTNFRPGGMSFEHSETTYLCNIVSSLSDFSLVQGQEISLTIALKDGATAPNIGDGISFNLYNGDRYDGATYIAKEEDTVELIATGLSTEIESKFQFLSASASGAVITIINEGAEDFHVSSFVGERSVVKETVNWAIRSMQFMTWAGNRTVKYQLQSALEDLLGRLADEVGFKLDTGEWVEFQLDMAKPDDAEVDKDVYCDIYIFTIKHMVHRTTERWSVISPRPEIC